MNVVVSAARLTTQTLTIGKRPQCFEEAFITPAVCASITVIAQQKDQMRRRRCHVDPRTIRQNPIGWPVSDEYRSKEIPTTPSRFE